MQWIGETLRQPVSPEKLPRLREIPITDRPRTAPEQAPAQERAAQTQTQQAPNRTQAIADKVRDARDNCTGFSDFRQRLAEQGKTYIQGIPYPIEVRGSFMIMGLEKNKQKRAILRVFDTFK